MDISTDLETALKSIITDLTTKDKFARINHIRESRLDENFFQGFQRLYWSDQINDWRSVDGVPEAELRARGINPEDLGRVMNLTRGHGEALIAALSQSLPSVKYFPADGDNPDDLLTSQTYTKCAELVQRHIEAETLFSHAVYILFTQHFVSAYNYQHESEKYGTYERPQYSERNMTQMDYNCPQCGGQLDSQTFESGSDQMDDASRASMECPDCQSFDDLGNTQNKIVQPAIQQSEYSEIFQSGTVTLPKTRECVEIYGDLNVLLPVNVKRLEDAPYLILDTEEHYTKMREMYPQFFHDITASGAKDEFERWARRPINTVTDIPSEYVTHRQAWLRNFTLNAIDDDDLRTELKQAFPDGVLCKFVNEKLVELIPEDMDAHWTVTENPLVSYIHGAPMCRPIIEVNYMFNDVITLVEETIRQGVPQTFVDPEVVDLDIYRDSDVEPGAIYPAKPKAGKNLDNSFFVTKTASLSQEVELFLQRLEQLGQFLLGSFPSIYGGPSSQGSKTLGEYEMSRNQALQRVSTYWKMLNSWWARMMEKSVRSFIENMRTDENYAQQSGANFVNIWIRRSEAIGNIGRVFSESSEQFPLSWTQKRGVLFDLMKLNKQPIDGAIFQAENIEFVHSIMGLDGLHIPGEDDRNKQLSEIVDMIRGNPVQIDALIDEHEIHIMTIKSYLKTAEGQDLKKTNQMAYMMIMEHLQAHMMALQASMMAQAPPSVEKPGPGPIGNKPAPLGTMETPGNGGL